MSLGAVVCLGSDQISLSGANQFRSGQKELNLFLIDCLARFDDELIAGAAISSRPIGPHYV